jgi:serine/threonine-protein kinase
MSKPTSEPGNDGDPLDAGLAEAFGPTSRTSNGVLGKLSETIGSAPRVSLRDTDPASGPEPLVQPGSTEMPGPAGRSSRLQLLGEIARGGMGAVLKGRDTDLGRDLAVKVLLERHRDHPDMVRRFVEEAQIGGQLQHPGVVPVYELGQFADQRPYFAMKLVKGRTLAALLDERTAADADLPRFLSIFEAVCQTVAYAHARGVIHRDLKPSNVMVGAFGEVQVMDWGLAKVLPQGGVVDDEQAGKVERNETVIATARSGGDRSDLSQAGSVMGTPSYMAPEQARGEIDVIDERADVFALGSILCEILTGEPAFTGPTVDAIQRKAARGDVREALSRLSNCTADSELIALATTCLAANHDERLRHAGLVSERTTAYLAGAQEKLRRAELARVEERARRRLTTGAAAGILTIAALAGGGWYWIDQGRQARRVTAVAALAEARLLGEQARKADAEDNGRWAEAIGAAKQAAALAAGAGDAPLRHESDVLLGQLEAAQREAEADRKLMADLEEIRLAFADDFNWKRADAACAAAFAAAGSKIDSVDPQEAARWILARRNPVELASYLDWWAPVRRSAKGSESEWRSLLTISQLVDPDPWRNQLRTIFASPADAFDRLHKLATDKSLAAQPAISLILLAHLFKSKLKDTTGAEQILQKAAVRYPQDFWVNRELASSGYRGPNEFDGFFREPLTALRYLTAAAALRPASAHTRNNLGIALVAAKMVPESIVAFREAIRLKPDFVVARTNLGNALRVQGRLDEAVAEYGEAIRLKPDYSEAHDNLGIALNLQGKLEEAVAEYREAIRIKPDFAGAHDNLGRALAKQGKLQEAVAEYREAIRIKPDSANAHNDLCLALRDQGKTEEAIAECREAVRLKPDFAEAHYNLGLTLSERGKLEEAIAEYGEAIRINPSYAFAHNNLAWLLAQQPDPNRRNLPKALAHARKAVELEPKDGTNFNTLGFVEYRSGNLDSARKALESSMKLQNGGDAYDWLMLAVIDGRQGRNDQARAWYDKSMDWTKKNQADDVLRLLWSEAAKTLGLPGPAKTNSAPR